MSKRHKSQNVQGFVNNNLYVLSDLAGSISPNCKAIFEVIPGHWSQTELTISELKKIRPLMYYMYLQKNNFSLLLIAKFLFDLVRK